MRCERATRNFWAATLFYYFLCKFIHSFVFVFSAHPKVIACIFGVVKCCRYRLVNIRGVIYIYILVCFGKEVLKWEHGGVPRK